MAGLSVAREKQKLRSVQTERPQSLLAAIFTAVCRVSLCDTRLIKVIHMLKSTIGASAAAIMALASPAAAQSAQDAFGTWQHPENGSHVEMYKCGDALCAKIVKVTDGQKSDDKNPDAGKRSRPVVGLVIMSGATKSGDNAWTGSLYNRADGATYSGTIKVKSKDALDLTGCTAVVLCKTVTWKRVK